MFKAIESWIKSWIWPPKETVYEPLQPGEKVSIHRDSVDVGFNFETPKDGAYKRIIIGCDGTWQDANSLDNAVCSNVTRLCHALRTDANKNQVQQVVYYQAGVGTGLMQRLIGGGLGVGLEENVREAYSFIANNYDEGDEIFLFGFSRGAYTVRSLAGLINEIGLLKKRSLSAFPEIYKKYKARHEDGKERKEKLNAYIHRELMAKHALWLHVPIKVIGCFDTVGSLGIPQGRISRFFKLHKKHMFHNTALSYGIGYAFHALALDERRKAFSPTLWYLPPMRLNQTQIPERDRDLPESEDDRTYKDPVLMRQRAESRAQEIKLCQCWFPGVHIDIGGGTSSKDFPEFSNLSLFWMVDQVKPFLAFDEEILVQIKADLVQRYAVTRALEAQKKGWFGSGRLPDNRTLFAHPELAEELRVGFRWETAKRNESFLPTNVTAWGGMLRRTPGFYSDIPRERGVIFKHGLITTKDWTNEVLHPVVQLRQNNDMSQALEELKAAILPGKSYWTLRKKDVLAIKEYRAPKVTAERILYNLSEFQLLYGAQKGLRKFPCLTEQFDEPCLLNEHRCGPTNEHTLIEVDDE